MEISIYKAVGGTLDPSKSVEAERVTFDSIADLENCITKHAWSPGVFMNDYRTNENFLHCDVFALDFDGGVTVVEIKKRLDKLNIDYSITLTRHHNLQKKENVASERFRLVMPLEKRIESKIDYEKFWSMLHRVFPEADNKCKDPARFFFASINGAWRGHG